MEKEHFSYPEALRFLANKYGIQIPEESEPTAKELADKTERESLFIINEFAKNYFHQNLQESTEGKAVGLSYFEERGFTNETIEKFQLGYCLNVSDDFTKAALKKDILFLIWKKLVWLNQRMSGILTSFVVVFYFLFRVFRVGF